MLVDEPCPYCGGTLELLTRGTLRDVGGGNITVMVGPVRCLDCDANSDDDPG